MKNYNRLNLVFLMFICNYANAANVISGVKSFTDFVSKLGMAISVVSFIAAGVMFLVNKNLGSEKLSGAIVGTVLIASASGLSSMIYTMFS